MYQLNQSWSFAATFLLVIAFSLFGYAGHSEQLELSYPRGDAYFLIGNLETASGNQEFASFATIARWLGKNGFRPILNPGATVADLREAVQNPRTSVILWSSHGSPNGEIRDVKQVPIPKDIFVNEAGPRLSNVIVSACHGECIVRSFERPPQMQWTYWEGVTNSSALQAYLVSTDFEDRLFKYMQNNPMSVELPGGALPGRPNKTQNMRCESVFN